MIFDVYSLNNIQQLLFSRFRVFFSIAFGFDFRFNIFVLFAVAAAVYMLNLLCFFLLFSFLSKNEHFSQTCHGNNWLTQNAYVCSLSLLSLFFIFFLSNKTSFYTWSGYNCRYNACWMFNKKIVIIFIFLKGAFMDSTFISNEMLLLDRTNCFIWNV